MYCDPGNALFVPVGEDQVAHVEFSREIVRRFNLYLRVRDSDRTSLIRANIATSNSATSCFQLLDVSSTEPIIPAGQELTSEQIDLALALIRQRVLEMGVPNFFESFAPSTMNILFIHQRFFEEPEALLTQTPRIPGLDGRKMSKSYGNAITLSESDDDIRKKTKVMVTDPARKRRTDPGNPDVCPVYDWHKLFSPPETLAWAAAGCRTAGIGCIECKSAMADNLIKWIAPVRERRLEYEQHPKQRPAKSSTPARKARESRSKPWPASAKPCSTGRRKAHEITNAKT